MALIKCKHCGGPVSTLAEKCPHCGAPIDEETPQPVETPPLTSGAEPQPAPEPAEYEEENFDKDEVHTSRYIMLAVVVLLLLVAGGYYYYQQSGANSSGSVMEGIAVSDTVVGDEQTETAAQDIAASDTEADDGACDTIPQSFELNGEMAGYPMSVSGQRDEGNTFHGTYRNLTYGTKMRVEGHITDQSLSFSGSVQGESFEFTLYKTSYADQRYEGICQHSGGKDLSVWLEMQ